MTTATDTSVSVGADGLTVVACAWCVPPARLRELGRTYRVSHGLCTTCAATFEGGGQTAP